MPSLSRETGRSLPETWKSFEPSHFHDGDEIAFHNPVTRKWEKGVLTGPPGVPVIDRDNRRIYVNGGAGGVVLEVPPKRVDDAVLKGKIELAIDDKTGSHTLVDFKVSIDPTTGRPAWNVGPEGEIEVTLVPQPATPGGAAPNHKEISNVNLDTLRNVIEIEQVEKGIDADLATVKIEINNIGSIRRKELLAKVSELDQKVRAMVKEMGHFDELGDINDAKIREVTDNIKKLRSVAEDGLADLRSELVRIDAEIKARGSGDAARKRMAEVMMGNVESEQKDALDKWKEYDDDQTRDKAHKAWVRKHAAWDARRTAREAEAAAWDVLDPAKRKGRRPEFTEDEPDEPDVAKGTALPTVSKEKAMNAYNVFVVKKALPATDPRFEIHRFLITKTEEALAKRKIDDGIVVDYPTLEKEHSVTGEVFLKVLEEWKNKDVGKEVEAFDFDKEKKELEDKIKELRTKFDALVAKNPSFVITPAAVPPAPDRIRGLLNTLGTYTKTRADVEKDMANLWNEVSDVEVQIFKEEQRIAPHSEKETNMDIDLPPNLLMDILRTRPNEVRNVMHHAYNTQIDGTGNESIVEALRQMFEPSPTQGPGRNAAGNLAPNDAVIARLRQYGIKDWRHFKKLWDEKLAPKAADLLQGIAQDDVRSEIARNASGWDNVRALGWQLGARVMTNLALVGGASVAIASVFATGGMSLAASVAVAGATGATAGGIRAGLQKFLFGSKWLEDRKQKQLEALAQRQRTQAIENLLTRRFGANHATAPAFAGDCERMFTALLATAAREASAEFVSKESAEGAGLPGDARRLYIQAIRDIELSGDVPTEVQKQKCALAIRRLMAQNQMNPNEMTVREAAHGDPMVIRILDGVMQGFSGAKASKENYGAKGAASTVLLGAGVGIAFAADQWYARAGMGALGGGLAGYHWGEGRRMRQEREQAQAATDALYNNAHQVLLRTLNTLETGAMPPAADLNRLVADVQLFNRLLDAKFDSVDQQRMAQILEDNKTLRTQVKDLVYQTYRRGVFAARALGTLEDHARDIDRKTPIVAGSTRAWWRKVGSRVAYTAGGALAGAGLAVLAGYGFQQFKEAMGWGVQPAAAPEVKAAAGAAATTVVGAGAGAPIHGGGGHDTIPSGDKGDVIPTGKSGADTHQIMVNKSPDYPAKSLGVYEIKKGGSAWRSIDQLHKSPAGKEAFADMNSKQFAEWRQDELERLGYKFLGDGKIAHPYMIHPGAKMELYTGGDGKPHVRLLGVEDGKVKILDHYIVREATAKGLVTEVEAPKATAAPNLKADATSFKAVFGKQGMNGVINDLPEGPSEKLFGTMGSKVNITDVKVIGDSGLVSVTSDTGHSVLAHPFMDKAGVWHLGAIDTIPDGQPTPAAAPAEAVAGGGAKYEFVSTGTDVDKAHLADVLSGKGSPEAVTVKGGASTEATGAETPEPKPGAFDAHLTKAEITEYKTVIKGMTDTFKNEMDSALKDADNMFSNKAGLKGFVSKDIDRVISETAKGLDKGQLPFELGQALEPNQSMSLADKLDLVRSSVHDVLLNDLSPESQLFLAGPNTDYAMPVSAWGDSESVFIPPGGGHLVVVELPPGNRWELIYDPNLTFTAAGPGQALIVEQPNGNSFAAALKADLKTGTYSIVRAT